MIDLFQFHSTPKTGFALLGLGCGVGVGAGAPVRLSGVPILGDAVSGIVVGLGSLDASLGRPSERLRAVLAKVSSSSSSSSSTRRSSSSSPLRLAAGAGCGLGLGYGVGVGLFVKKSAGEDLRAKVAAAFEKVQGGAAAAAARAGLSSPPAITAAATATSAANISSSLESRVEELESLVCELRPEHGLCAARRKKKKEEEEEEEVEGKKTSR